MNNLCWRVCFPLFWISNPTCNSWCTRIVSLIRFVPIVWHIIISIFRIFSRIRRHDAYAITSCGTLMKLTFWKQARHSSVIILYLPEECCRWTKLEFFWMLFFAVFLPTPTFLLKLHNITFIFEAFQVWLLSEHFWNQSQNLSTKKFRFSA